MPISAAYVVQYLLESSRPGPNSVGWSEKDTGFWGHLNGLDLYIESIPSNIGTRTCLTISNLPERVQICEPQRVGVFKPKYKDEDDERLARLLNDLLRTADRQCELRKARSQELSDRVREAIFRQLIRVEEPVAETPELITSSR